MSNSAAKWGNMAQKATAADKTAKEAAKLGERPGNMVQDISNYSKSMNDDIQALKNASAAGKDYSQGDLDQAVKECEAIANNNQPPENYKNEKDVATLEGLVSKLRGAAQQILTKKLSFFENVEQAS